MTGKSRKRQANQSRNRSTQQIDFQVVKPFSINKTQTSTLIYDASKYVKNDIKWSAITTGIVVIVLVTLYVIFH
jgi:hypothetical protein